MLILDVFFHAGAFGSPTPEMDIFSNASEVLATILPALNVLSNTSDHEALDDCSAGFGMQYAVIHVPSEVLRCCTDRHRWMIWFEDGAILARGIESNVFAKEVCDDGGGVSCKKEQV